VKRPRRAHGSFLIVVTLFAGACTAQARDTTALGPTNASTSSVRPLVDGQDLEPGTYELALESLRITFTVPAGWTAWTYGALPIATGGDPPGGSAIGFWIVDDVFTDACDWNRGMQGTGPSVADLAAALEAQRGGLATDPKPVSLAGFNGQELTLRVPLDLEFDFEDCWGFEYHRWTALPFGGRYNQGPGQADQLRILDVDGVRLVVNTSYYPGTSPAAMEELRAIVESVRIAPAVG
jgi:hypothetical protein